MKVCAVCKKEIHLQKNRHTGGTCSEKCSTTKRQRDAIAKIGGSHEHNGVYHRFHGSGSIFTI